MEQDLGSFCSFSTRLYTAKEAVGTAPLLAPFFFHISSTLRGGDSSNFFQAQRRSFSSGMRHTQNNENPLLLDCQNSILHKDQ